jgi:REP element-mobilizing transposase RayT
MAFKTRREIRLPDRDYARPGGYFVTIVTRQRESLFGRIRNQAVSPSPFGEIVQRCWFELPDHYPNVVLDEMVVMPDHFHGIIQLQWLPDPAQVRAVQEIVRALKGFSTRKINELRRAPGKAVWQRGYYERIVRNERELSRIRTYIWNNPASWALHQPTHNESTSEKRVDLRSTPTASGRIR